MTKDEFILTLQNALSGMPRADLERTVQYYREMIEDRMEEGMGEEAAVADVGDPIELAAAIRKMPAKRTAVSTPKEPKAPKERKPMSAGKKAALVICAVLLVCAGLGCILGSMNLGRSKVMEKEYAFADANIRSLEIESGSAEVKLFPASDGVCTVRCAEGANLDYKVWIVDGTLHIERVSKWSLFPISLTGDYIRVYLPDPDYEALWVHSSSGGVGVPMDFHFDNAILNVSSGGVEFAADVTYELNIQSSSGGVAVAGTSPERLFISCSSGGIQLVNSAPGEVTLHSTSGSVKAEHVRCKAFESSCTSGSQRFSDVIVDGLLRVDGTSGSVKLDDCDAGEVQVAVVSGSVSGNFLTPKVYDLRSASGSVAAPSSAAPTPGSSSAGRCTVRTTSGSIKFE
jgi:hypothetical protein